MAVTTVRDLCRGALQDLGRLGAGEPLSADDADLALERLNAYLDQCAAERLSIYFTSRTTQALTPSDGEYTVGTGGDFNRVRPVFIDGVRFMDTSGTPDVELPLVELLEQDYRALTIKDLESTYPTSYFYESTFPLGTLTFWPAPTSATITGVLYAPTAVARFATINDAFSLPPGYERFLRTNLALELAAPFEKEPSAYLREAARESRTVVKKANSQGVILTPDPLALVGWRGSYDIRTG